MADSAILRVGVVSDTHIPHAARALPAALLKALEGVDAILHAGDIACLSALRALEQLAPTYAVAGNCDPPEVRSLLPDKRVVEIGGRRIGLVHGRGGVIGSAERARAVFHGEALDAVVYGHTHQPWEEWRGSLLCFNPGSPTSLRFTDVPTYGILTISDALEGAIQSFR